MMWDIRNFVILGMAALLWWFGTAIIRLENYRYGSDVGLCRDFKGLAAPIQRHDCLMSTETRSHPLWHLAYGLGVIESAAWPVRR